MATLDAEDRKWISEEIVRIARSPEFQLGKTVREQGQINALLATPITLSDGSTMTVGELYMVIRRHEKQFRLLEGLNPA